MRPPLNTIRRLMLAVAIIGLVLGIIGEKDPGTYLPRFPNVGRIRIHGDDYVRSEAGQSARKIHYFHSFSRFLDSCSEIDTILATI